MKKLAFGDYTGLASNYSRYRPGYSRSVLSALLGLIGVPVDKIDFVDVGAGTGIWTRMVSERGVRSSIAIEPNDDMRKQGQKDSIDMYDIYWLNSRAERTSLTAQCCNWLTMASSFHWVDFDLSIREFHRLLCPNGWFTALWNPRLIEVNPILVEIESFLDQLKPSIERVSSGRSGITETLTEKLTSSSYFEDIVYIEGQHVIRMTPEHYVGVWNSVNDLRVQLGEESFLEFMAFVERRVGGLSFIETTYLTRAWSARRKAQ